MRRRRKDPSLAKIITVIVAVGVLAVLGLRGWQWVRENVIDGNVEANAPQDLETARNLAESGQHEEAKRLLGPIVSRVRDEGIVVDALMLLSRLENESGNVDVALDLLKRAATEFPDSPDQPKAAVAYARLLEESGHGAEAVSMYTKVREDAPGDLRAPALTGLGRTEEQNGNLWEARELYAEAVRGAEWGSAAWSEALEQLGRVNVGLLFSPRETPESEAYAVEKGDSLTKIGMKLNTTQGLLTRANDMEPGTTLRVGQRLKYTPKDFRIVIECSTCRLFLLDNEGLFKCYETGLGKEGHETTLGTYRIGDKQKDPTWYKPGSPPIPPGDPANELGTRWMPFVPEEDGLPRDLGIHGTPHPETVGKYSSKGCVRLRMDEVEELYNLVVRSTPVDVVDVFQPAAVQ